MATAAVAGRRHADSVGAGTPAGGGGGGTAAEIGEAPSSRTPRHRQSSSLKSPSSPSAIDKFMKALLPQSAFPSSIVQSGGHSHHPNTSSEVGGIGAESSNTLSRTSSLSSVSSSIRQQQHSSFGNTPGKSKNRVPRSSIGAGKAAHAHRHNLSVDSSTLFRTTSPQQSPSTNMMVTRTRSKTGVAPSTAPPVTGIRSASPASFYAGGIGESPSPANRSRQNSASSSLGSTHLTSSMFSHRQSNSSATQPDAHNMKGGALNRSTTSSRLNSAGSHTIISPNTNATHPNTATTSGNPGTSNGNTLPSIRGYTTFTDSSLNLSSTGLSSARPRTPLLDPFMRYRQTQPSTSAINESSVGNEPPRLGMPYTSSTSNDDPAPSESYVASLALAPLVSRPTRDGQPLYISGGRTPDTLHAAPSSTYSTPAMAMPSPSMAYTASHQPGNPPSGLFNNATSSQAPRNGALDSTRDNRRGRDVNNAGLGVGGQPGPSRLRSNSVDSYLQRDDEEEETHARHTRQQSSGGHTGGFGSFFSLLGGGNLANTKSRSRKGSLSNTVNTGETTPKMSSRFVHYGQPSTTSRPRTPNSEHGARARQRSSSFGGTGIAGYRFSDDANGGRDSPTHHQIGASTSADARGRDPRSHPATRTNSRVTSSSLGRRRSNRSRGGTGEDHIRKSRNKLISARLPPDVDHRDARIPSQPLGYTWICGSHSAARTPSFYDEFDYVKYPGGKRKRSMSRSTITPRTYTTGNVNNASGVMMSRDGSGAGVNDRGIDTDGEELAYESEPEFLARQRARNANKSATSINGHSAGGASRSREAVHLLRDEGAPTVQDEATQTTPRYGTPSIEDLYKGNLAVPDHRGNTYISGALLTAHEEKAVRRRSRSLINLRKDGPMYTTQQGGSIGHGTVNHAIISQPFRESSSDFIRTPRTAPVPMSIDEGLAVPPLFMGESVIVSAPLSRSSSSARRTQAGATANAGDGTTTLRRAPSRASIEAMDDPEKRREALFAALPPPARRSPTPASMASSHMYPTGRVLADETTAYPVPTREMQALDLDARQGEEVLQYSSADRSGALSPPIDDFSQFEASRVIISESDLLSPANAQERFPVVYGQAFSTAHESLEGEILDTSPILEDNSGLFRDRSRDSGASRNSLTPLPEHVFQMRQDTSGSGGSGSASRSISNGSARILDLNEESFTNLFYKAPPPSKPLPSLPSDSSTQSPSSKGSGPGSGAESSPSQARDERKALPTEYLGYTERTPVSSISEDRFPTPDFSVVQTFDIGRVASEISSDRDSRRETLTHPFARVSPSHPSAGPSRPHDADNDFSNIDEGLLQGGKQVWPPMDYEEEEPETLLQPPPMARNFTSSTARTIDSFYTVTGGQSNASSSALNAPSLHHQESFVSARSHLTATSAARTPMAEFPPTPASMRDRGQFIDDDHSDDERDYMATIRRTDLSPIFVTRPSIPAQFAQQLPREGTSSPAHSSRPGTATGSEGQAKTDSNRESFIDFEPVVPVRSRAASDTRSFIDDDSDEDEDAAPRSSESAVGPASSMTAKLNRPSVIVEHLDEEDQRYASSDGLSPLQPTTPHTPLYPPGSATTMSHYSLTPSDIIDNYRSRESSNDPSRNSQDQFSLGLPITPKEGDRSSGGSHTHSVSNVSIMSSLSKLEDFPEPPPSVTPAYEKDEATAMMPMQHQASRSTLGNGDGSNITLRPRGSSLPTGPHNQSRATINTQGTQTTSIYTFTSSADGGSAHNSDDKPREEAEPMQRQESSSSQRKHGLFEFPMRRSTSKRSTLDSFIDTATSPDRGTFSVPPFDSQQALSSASTSRSLSRAATADKRPLSLSSSSSNSSPHSQPSRLSGIFHRRQKHERTFSDPSISNVRRANLVSTRRDSGGFESQEEKRQSWR